MKQFFFVLVAMVMLSSCKGGVKATKSYACELAQVESVMRTTWCEDKEMRVEMPTCVITSFPTMHLDGVEDNRVRVSVNSDDSDLLAYLEANLNGGMVYSVTRTAHTVVVLLEF